MAQARLDMAELNGLTWGYVRHYHISSGLERHGTSPARHGETWNVDARSGIARSGLVRLKSGSAWMATQRERLQALG
jgi:hypothetical protein